jgi:hypothetical protein
MSMSIRPCTEYVSPGVDLGVLSQSTEPTSVGLDGSSLIRPGQSGRVQVRRFVLDLLRGLWLCCECIHRHTVYNGWVCRDSFATEAFGRLTQSRPRVMEN